MYINDYLEEKNFYIRRLLVEINGEIKNDVKHNVNINVSFGIAQPIFTKEDRYNMVVFPFLIEIDSPEVQISFEFIMGFHIKTSILSDVEFKKMINENGDEFTKRVNKTINKIVSNALKYSNIKFANELFVDRIYYPI
ncbi:hypothetical protein [Pasteurella sp. PK-2025]|uniref:hypothetical protein n=1 Tax=unclassified Pasteurella TaxID=2621516 RepID=UPI003C784C28